MPKLFRSFGHLSLIRNWSSGIGNFAYMVHVWKKEGESAGALIYRFTKKVQQSGVLREAKKRRFRTRPRNKIKIRLSAIHREVKKREYLRAKKLGIVS